MEPTEEIVDTLTGSAIDTVRELWMSFASHLPFVAGSLFVLLMTSVVALLVRFAAQRALGRVRRESLRELILRLLTILVWALGVLLAAIVLFPGLTPARAIGGLGLLSVAVGLAFKDIFENFFAGMLILWRFPFERGDFIECEEILGRAERIHVRMSYIRKTNGELVVVPNSFLFKNPVKVLTNMPKRRITIMAGVAYGEDVSESVSVITQAVRTCETVDPDRPVEVFPQGFGSSSIDIEVCWWTDPTPLAERRSRGEVVTAIKQSLDRAGIEIPFPYRTLTFKEPLPLARSDTAPPRDTEDDR